MDDYRILSLDGGGSWALIQAIALQDLYGDAPGHELLGQFDFAVANSGGSIVLAGLLCNKKPSEILAMLMSEQQRKTVFVALNFWDQLKYSLSRAITGGPRYYAEKKLEGLRKYLQPTGNMQLPDVRAAITSPAKPHFVITSFDRDRLRSVMFRSDLNSKCGSSTTSGLITLAEAVHAASNAPIKYFDNPAQVMLNGQTRHCWDGGLAGLNNPVLAGVIEVLGNGYHIDPATNQPRKIRVLSIGTATVRRPLQDGTIDPPLAVDPVDNPNWKDNLETAATAILDDPPDIGTFNAHVILGGGLKIGDPTQPTPVIRMNPVIGPILTGSQWTLPPGIPDMETFQTLVNLDMDAVEQSQVELIRALAYAWLEGTVANQPIRADDLLQPQIGHATYTDAKAAW